jgi:DNA-binding MarR family transcriptional regulator
LRSLPALKWLIDGEIQDHAVNVLVGPPANGKSFIAIDYACQIAQTENVIYMAGEGEYGLNPRLTAWEYHHQKLTDKHLHICLGAVEIMLEGELSAFLEAVKHLKPKLVIVDTLARAMISGDENNSKDMKAFVAGCSEIMKQLGCAVLLVHHTRKDGDVYRGSNVLEGNVDVMLSCTMNDDVITLKSTKFKDRAASNGKFYRLLPKVIITPDGKQLESAVLIPAEQYEPGEELTQSQTSILRLLSDEDEEYYRKDVIDTLHLPLGTVVNAVKVLKKRGFITGEKNSPYRITEDGRQFLARIESIESRESLYSGNTIERPANTIDSPDSIDSVDSIAPKPLPLRPVNSPFATYQTAAEKKADLAAAYQRGKERALLENQEAL